MLERGGANRTPGSQSPVYLALGPFAHERSRSQPAAGCGQSFFGRTFTNVQLGRDIAQPHALDVEELEDPDDPLE